MTTERIYLDANAGVPLLPAARQAMVAALEAGGNASSVHAEGRAARRIVEEARAAVAALAGAVPGNVVFTSGATEAAATALSPTMRVGGEAVTIRRLYVGATEHPCVLAGGRFAAEQVVRLPVRADGTLDLDALGRTLDAHDAADGPFFLALMLANNETGVVHPVAEVARRVKARDGLVFCDAVQAPGRIAVDIAALGVDFLALSAHKLGGPQGAGALVLAEETVRPEPLMRGGGQESYRRAGTENVAAIAGFGVAASAAGHHLQEAGRLEILRDRLEAGIAEVAPEALIVGSGGERLPNTVLFAVPGLSAETAVIAFDLEGIAVSSGSACSSGKVGPSHVLEAMGVAPELRRSGIRASLGPESSEADVEGFLAAWRGIYARLRPAQAA
jgi:cysteine desulfurase